MSSSSASILFETQNMYFLSKCSIFILVSAHSLPPPPTPPPQLFLQPPLRIRIKFAELFLSLFTSLGICQQINVISSILKITVYWFQFLKFLVVLQLVLNIFVSFYFLFSKCSTVKEIQLINDDFCLIQNYSGNNSEFLFDRSLFGNWNQGESDGKGYQFQRFWEKIKYF